MEPRMIMLAVGAAILVGAVVGSGFQGTLGPRFAAAGCEDAKVTVYEGVYDPAAREVRLLLDNGGRRLLVLEKYESRGGKAVQIPGTIYLSPGSREWFTFPVSGPPDDVVVADRDCRAADLWAFG